MNPKHHNPTKSNRVAHAPYNFVPLPEKVVPGQTPLPSHDRYDSNRYTGHLDCTLITKSPVYTRTALNPEFFADWADRIDKMMKDPDARNAYAQFFHLDDAQRPVIPGSSLRGMTRMLMEIVGYGKAQWVTDQKLFFRTVDNSAVGKHYRSRMGDKVEGGILRYDSVTRQYCIEKWHVARVHRKKLGSKLYDGKAPNLTPKWEGKLSQYQRVWVRLSENEKFVDEIKFSQEDDFQEGILVITGNAPKKKKEFVLLVPQGEPEKIVLDEALIWRFHDDDQITRWQRKAFPKHRPRRNSRDRDGMLRKDRFLAREGDPVFFLREAGKVTFFGRAHFFRLPYVSSPSDLISKTLQEVQRDLAEAVFGFVEDKRGVAGRVFVTDAVAEVGQNNVWLSENPVIPQILSSPKPTSFQHYLVQDQRQGHDPNKKDTLAHYDTPSGKTTIRGHKLYWHKDSAPKFIEQQAVDWKSDTQHTQIKPVRPGVTFHFRVYFENLSEEELGALLWVLDLPQGHYHKIGMGKPLGLGAVEIKPRLILTDRQDRYRKLFGQNTWHEATREEGDVASFKQAFEAYVLKNMDSTEHGDAKSLADVERIQHLLKMLEWPGPSPGPSPELTEYMDLKEFRHRPVLPDPLHIQLELNKGKRASPKPKTPPRRKVSKPKPPSGEQKPQVLQSAKDAQEEMIVRGVIKAAETNRFVVVIEKDVPGSLTFENAHLQDLSSDTAESYVGMKIIAKIKRINKRGNIQLEALKWEKHPCSSSTSPIR